jgi:c-di-GMP-binding flagellar brake protein YcgR
LSLADAGRARDDPPVHSDRSAHEPRRVDPAERRRSPRVEISVSCTLQRKTGSPIQATTLELGSGGMRIASDRPLRVDEALDFDILRGAQRLTGHARVMRQHERRVYALRFERLHGVSREALRALMAQRPTD